MKGEQGDPGAFIPGINGTPGDDGLRGSPGEPGKKGERGEPGKEK